MSTIQESLTRQQFSMIMSSLLQSLRIACSFIVFKNHCQNRSPQLSTVPIQQLPQCNRLLVLCEFENYAVTDATK